MNKINTIVCSWVGEGEGCRCPTLYGKAYCEDHYNRVYETFLPEMADYIINKELNANRTLAQYKSK